jgi:hypothetical protein
MHLRRCSGGGRGGQGSSHCGGWPLAAVTSVTVAIRLQGSGRPAQSVRGTAGQLGKDSLLLPAAGAGAGQGPSSGGR